MSIASRQIKKELNRIVEEKLKAGELPPIEYVIDKLSDYYSQVDVGFPSFQLRKQGYRQKWDVNVYNNNLTEIYNDLNNLYEELIDQFTITLTNFDYYDTERHRLMYQIKEMESSLLDLLLTAKDTDGYLYSVHDDFKDRSNINLAYSTCEINTDAGIVTLRESRGGVKKIDMSHYFDTVNFPILAEEEYAKNIVSNKLLGGSKFGYAFSDITTSWLQNIITNTSGKLEVSFIIDLNPTLKYNILLSRIEMIGQSPQPMGIEPLWSVDNVNFKALPIGTGYRSKLVADDKKTIWNFSEINARYIKFLITKNQEDESVGDVSSPQYRYVVGFKHIEIFKMAYSKESTLYSNAFIITDPTGEALTVDKAAIIVDHDLQPGTDIEYYLSLGADTNIVAHWKMNDNSISKIVEDAMGEHHGRSIKSTMDMSTTGRFGNALSFNGESDYVDISDSDDFSFGDGTSDKPFSISAWINMDYMDSNSADFPILTKYSNTNGEYEWYFGIINGKLYFYTLNSIGTVYRGRYYNGNLTSYMGTWINLVGIYDGKGLTASFKIYLNGTQIDDKDYTTGSYTAMSNTSANVAIGFRDAATDEYADGKIDDVRLYNKVLSTTEISDLSSNIPDLNPSLFDWVRVSPLNDESPEYIQVADFKHAAFFQSVPDITWDSATYGTALETYNNISFYEIYSYPNEPVRDTTTLYRGKDNWQVNAQYNVERIAVYDEEHTFGATASGTITFYPSATPVDGDGMIEGTVKVKSNPGDSPSYVYVNQADYTVNYSTHTVTRTSTSTISDDASSPANIVYIDYEYDKETALPTEYTTYIYILNKNGLDLNIVPLTGAEIEADQFLNITTTDGIIDLSAEDFFHIPPGWHKIITTKEPRSSGDQFYSVNENKYLYQKVNKVYAYGEKIQEVSWFDLKYNTKTLDHSRFCITDYDGDGYKEIIVNYRPQTAAYSSTSDDLLCPGGTTETYALSYKYISTASKGIYFKAVLKRDEDTTPLTTPTLRDYRIKLGY